MNPEAIVAFIHGHLNQVVYVHCAAILAHPTQSDTDLCLRVYIRIYTAGIL